MTSARGHSRTRRWATPVLVGIAMALTAGLLSAHDFWIVPDAFQVSAGGTLEIRGQTSTKFPTSLGAVTPERVAEARLIGASSDERLTQLSTSGKSLLIRHRPTTPGQHIVAVALVARSTRTTPERLKRYIALEGAPALAERHEREGAFPKTDSVTQISAKFAKTLVEVGQGGSRAFARTVGHELELVPVNDPSALHAGDSLVVRLLYHGRPVAGAHLHAGAAPTGLTATSDSAQAAAAPAAKDISVETGPDGTARIRVGEPGLWNVRTVHAAAAPGTPGASGGPWEAFFATLVFNVTATNGASGSAGDSIDVAAVVQRFDALMAAGDSAGILALLADDAVVLESGGMETRAEFRAHHLPADINFARAVKGQQGPITVRVEGDVAWASSTTIMEGELRGRQINSVSAELIVFSRESGTWKIRAIHWSSRNRRPPGGP
jgi:ketosteroid isomerase-like protein